MAAPHDFYVQVDMHGLEILNHRLHNVADDTPGVAVGDIWYRSDTGEPKVRSTRGSTTSNRPIISDDDDFHNRLSLEATNNNDDEILLWDSSRTAVDHQDKYVRMTRANFLSGAGTIDNAYMTITAEAGVTSLVASGEETLIISGDGSVYETTGSTPGTDTLTFTLKTQTANLVFAGPSSGGAAAPTFRALVDLDMPTSYDATAWDGAASHAAIADGNPHGTDLADFGYTFTTTLDDPGLTTEIVSASGIRTAINALASGLDPKESVVCNSDDTSNEGTGYSYTATGGTKSRGQITFSSGPTTIDGVTLANGDRILNSETGAAGGIWVRTSATVWDRATDFDDDAEVTAGAYVFIEEGTSYADEGWILTTNDPITIGGASGTSLSWSTFSRAGGYTAGDGMALATGAFSLDFNNIAQVSTTLGTNDRFAFYDATTNSRMEYITYANMVTAIAGSIDLADLTDGDGITDFTYDGSGIATISVDVKANSGITIDTGELSMNLGASGITGTLAVTDGGTGKATITDHAILYATAANTLGELAWAANSVLCSSSTIPMWVGLASDGYLVIGGASGPYAAALTEGSDGGLTVTNGQGSITLALDFSDITNTFTDLADDDIFAYYETTTSGRMERLTYLQLKGQLNADLTFPSGDTFSTWDVNNTDSGYTWGTSDVVASGSQTIDLIAGSGIAIDSDATNDAIRIRATGSGGLTSAYVSMSDGTTTASASAGDTFYFTEGADGGLTAVVSETTNDHVTLSLDFSDINNAYSAMATNDIFAFYEVTTSGRMETLTWGNLITELNSALTFTADDQDLGFTASTGTVTITDGNNTTIGGFATASENYGFVIGSNSVGATYFLDGSGTWSVPILTSLSASGLTAGEFLIATGATTYAWTGITDLTLITDIAETDEFIVGLAAGGARSIVWSALKTEIWEDHTIGNHSEVTITSAADNHLLVYDTSGTTLVNKKAKHSEVINGDDLTTDFDVVHSLGTEDIVVQVWDETSDDVVTPSIVKKAAATTTTVTIAFATAPATGTDYKVVIYGFEG